MKIYKFSTPACTWCKVVHPQVYEYAQKHGIEVVEVNADNDVNSEVDKALTKQHDVMSVPVVVFEGETTQKLTGFQEIMSFINQ